MESITNREAEMAFHILGRKHILNCEEKSQQDQFFGDILLKVFVISTPCQPASGGGLVYQQTGGRVKPSS